MKMMVWGELDDAARRQLLERGREAIDDTALTRAIGDLIDDVANRGDQAVADALRDHDGVDIGPEGLRVEESEIDTAGDLLPEGLKGAIREGIANIRGFNETLIGSREWEFELGPGVRAGERLTPIASAGLFVPSGKGSFPSVLMQIGVPAVVAGVPRIAVVVPPIPGGSGEVDPAVLFVAAELGLREVFRVNGPAGVAALALGTETIPKVLKVLGPGSPPVQAAQIACQVRGCLTQMLLGPSECMIIADDSADPRLLAADLLNEAEHGSDSAAVLVTDSSALIGNVQAEMAPMLAALPDPRRDYAAAAIGANGGAILVEDLDEAVEVANLYAAEHLQVAVRDGRGMAARILHAGEILIGQDLPPALANYLVGVPASLPTGGFARVTGGVTAATFLKSVSIAEVDAAAMERLGPAALELAEHEGFPAHAAALRARLGD